jgi:hypothetical protein
MLEDEAAGVNFSFGNQGFRKAGKGNEGNAISRGNTARFGDLRGRCDGGA